jgi:hypothetical protein
MDRRLYFAGFGLEFASVSEPKEAVLGYPPVGGCAPTLSLPLFRREWAEQPVARYFDTRSGLPETPGVATGGAEVLVYYALNSIELTNQFLRFPRVRQ